ncbi:hypothetical protein SISNIDRAFT_471277 [Sistotremastrum niveocremeum HHB9708]|uniref:Uncharacterized protein n=1 Tax=Sistotremastrum niveocremeum HHB9708 TaxID=1314777 RepID=A0A164MUG1_9AGAM|nr:hypothetical protein SISNIDRAFT_471277 [Sistotremastrum niveocremeum HHB9708]
MSSTANDIRNNTLSSPLSPILSFPRSLSSSSIPMPLAADVNANLLRSLKIVQSLGEAVPHGGILKAVAGIGITILETADQVRQNKEECADIARRAAEHISVLNRIDEEEELSDDLVERLGQEVLKKVERLGTESSWKRTLRSSSVQDETKDCLNRLNEAYQMYIFEASVATDNKLTTLVRGMNALSLRLQVSPRTGEADEIPLNQLNFGQEIQLVDKKTYFLRVEHGQMTDIVGRPRRVILRRFEAKPDVEDDDRRLEEFRREVGVRHDLLHQHFARMLGIASSKTGRTKMIVIEGGRSNNFIERPEVEVSRKAPSPHTITFEVCPVLSIFWSIPELCVNSWYGKFSGLSTQRLMDDRQDTDFFGNTEALGEEGAQDKRLCMGGLGRLDGRWEDSGWRMEEAFGRALMKEQLRDGDDGAGAGSLSFEEYADEFEQMRKSVTKWNEEKTAENARDLWDWLKWWSRSSETEPGIENSPTVGEIGWIDGNRWHPIPLDHLTPPAQPYGYAITADRWRDGEWETIVGTAWPNERHKRWSIDVSPGETIHLGTYVRSDRTTRIADFFYGSALSLAKDSGVDVRSLRLVSRTGFDVNATVTISDEQFSTVYYFAHPPYFEGSVPDPPGLWSRCPYNSYSYDRISADAGQVSFRLEPFVEYQMIDNPSIALLQDLDSHGFLPVPDITYASDPPFASITEVTDQHASNSTIVKRAKKRFGDALLSAFSKKRKTSQP